MRLRIEPRVEQRAALWRYGQDVVAFAAIRLGAVIGDLRAAAIRTPPEILVLIGFADGQRNHIAAGLVGDRAGRLLFPRLAPVETGRAGGGADVVGIHERAA